MPADAQGIAATGGGAALIAAALWFLLKRQIERSDKRDELYAQQQAARDERRVKAEERQAENTGELAVAVSRFAQAQEATNTRLELLAYEIREMRADVRPGQPRETPPPGVFAALRGGRDRDGDR